MSQHKPTVSRRTIVRMMAALPLGVAACGTDSPFGILDTGTDIGADTAIGDATADAIADTAADAAADVAADTAADVAAGSWATGGTASMTAAASYPDPFDAGNFTTCELTCSATIGPCHTTSPERQDISDGWDGLPVRLALQVVDENCDPVEGVIVEVWHTNYRGGYSGDINEMCTERDEDKSAQFFRGFQRTDAEGKVAFDTCYPGWYNGRAVHIHFRVLAGDYDAADGAAAEIISQLFFSDELNAEIFGEATLYDDFGEPDTSLTTDNIIGGEDDPVDYICHVERMTDGAMLASARIVLAVAGDSCSLSGAGGGGGGGGRP